MMFSSTNEDMNLLVSSQELMERTFSKYQLIPCIKDEFYKAGFHEAIAEAEIPHSFGIDLLVQMTLHRRATIPVLVGILKQHFEDMENSAQVCADMILKMAEADFVDWEDIPQQIVMLYDITDEVKEQLDIFQYPLPMIEEPSHVRHNRQYGYRTIRGSIILKNNHTDDDVCLDHINRSNQIPLALNKDVVAFVQNQWSNLDKPKDTETFEDYQKRVRAFEKYDKTSRDVLAALMAQGDRFWITHKYDKRGRTYTQGYHVNPQGNDWNKACIEFADAEKLNDS